MANPVKVLMHSLSRGEVSTAALARVDHEKLKLAAEIQENLMPHVIGKGMVRPGTAYLGTTASNAQARMIPFVKSPTDTALIEMSNALMRVWVDDAVLTRASVTSTVTNGDFSSSSGWTLTATTGASAAIGSGVLTLSVTGRGGSAYCERSVTTSSAGTEHALRIVVDQGPVQFRCGSSSGGQDYISETTLDTGEHSLAFTPSGTYYVRLILRDETKVVVDSITVEASGAVTFTAPWSTADLQLIRYAQSIDVIFLACESWQQRKIERRGTRSWSLVLYETDDGPFVTEATNGIKLTPSANTGEVTLTASENLFTSDHVGSLVEIFSKGYDMTFNLSAEDQYTDAVRIYGVGTDKNFTIVISGTWAGTLTRQNSLDGVDTGFASTSATYTANGSNAITPGDAYNNVPFWVRVGFEPGDYTSGTATVQITARGGGRVGVARITAYSSPTSVTAQILSAPSNKVATDDWSLGAWSAVKDWPSAVSLFDGRLWWGGSDKFWGSESDGYYAFNLDDAGDSGSIQRALATGGTINRVKWILPLQRLIFGTDGAEISARSSSFDEPLTPTNVTLKDASTHGAAAFSPCKLDGRGLFIHRDGKQLMEVAYNFEANDYQSKSLMLVNDTIAGDGFSAAPMAQRSPETYIWVPREDGQVPCLLYDPSEKTTGWWRFIAAASSAADAEVEDVVVLPSSGRDRVYFIVKRTINGGTVRYLEKLALHTEAEGGTSNRMLDSYIYNAGPVTTFSGLSHLEGETVMAWGTYNGVTGKIGTTYTVSSGQITLPGSCTDVVVGLSYNWRYKSAKLAYGAEGGVSLLMPKRIARLGLLTQNTAPDAIEYGSNFTTTYKLPRIEGGTTFTSTTVRSTYDEQTFPLGGSWDTDARLCLKGSAPLPATINAIVLGIETNEN